MVALNIVHHLLVSLKEKKRGDFDLVLNLDCEIEALRLFVADKKLVMEENVEKCACTVSKP